MTRENKLALIVGFSVILVVGVLVSDHFSKARQDRLRDLDEQEIGSVGVDRSTSFVPVEPLISNETTPIAAAPQPTPTRRLENTPWSAQRSSGGLLDRALDAQANRAHRAALERPTRAAPTETTANAPLEDSPLFIRQGEPLQPEGTLATADRSATARLLENALDRGVNLVPLTQPATVASGTVRTEPVGSTAPTRERARASTREAERPTPWEYHVRKNDSLYAIAEKHLGSGARWTEIRDLNKDRLNNGSVLRVGLRLRMPPDARRPDRIDPAPRVTPARSGTPGKLREYTVASGDTLGQISQRMLGTVRRMDEIIKANADLISDADEIREGMTLRIPPR
ncbi:MAG: LysM peptidoglycan-binding domain-containing protein [Phycisphaerales bacterium JB059]